MARQRKYGKVIGRMGVRKIDANYWDLIQIHVFM